MRLQINLKRNIISVAATLSIISGFGYDTTIACNKAIEISTTDTLSADRELPLPKIPSELRTPRERAAYLLTHFWDAMDFTDTSAGRNRAFMEQNFVNFASVFPHADTTAVIAATDILLHRAEADKQAYMMLAEIAEKYLFEADSPLCNDNFYIIFLEEMLRSPILGEYDKIRPAYQLNTARKNRVGSTAADFAYVGRDGRNHTLHETTGESILLVFYDPECEHCMEIMTSLRDDSTIRTAVSENRLAVIAVFADGDRKSWQSKPNVISGEWTDALDTTGVQEQELYSFKQLPALYLLDEDKRVLLKECGLQTIAQSLIQRFKNPAVGSVDNGVLQ